ncbi:glycosyltransferase family 4 protein [Ensifer sp. IC4062]|nr:glycosyltransferase family 4 protein [Ensifer sp. IC4062]MCA1440285.1 glycosyltransferase family 4 protein [Ensifer sp. IC4062]
MKIAQIAPLFESVPPKLYGGAERVVHHLTEELVRQGHEVTLFASGDSMTSAKLIRCSETALRLNPTIQDPIPYHVMMIEQVRRLAKSFNVLHFHIDLLHFPVVRSFANKTLTTLHGRLDLPDLKPFYDFFPDMPLVSISDDQRKPMPPVNWVGTVHHGLPPDVLPFNSHPKGGYLAFLGRVSPEKRPDRAIEIAGRVNLPLRIAAKIDKVDERYWRSEIEPLVQRSANAEFIGEINEHQKAEFLGNARALLFPIDWPEPFGLVMIEAMACGTPVIAFRCGSVPEIIDDGVSGFVVDSMEEAVKAVQSLDRIDRRAVRATFEERFTAQRMASDYLEIYRSLAGGRQKVMSIPAMSDSGFGTDFTEVV